MNTWQENITYSDSTTNIITFYSGEKNVQNITIMIPAMGVRASYYTSFAERLAFIKATTIAIIDLRGLGKSSVRASKNDDYGYKFYIQDLNELILRLKKKYQLSTFHIMGHSLGGQLGCLYASRYPFNVNHLTLIATCLPYYKAWEMKDKIRLYIAGNLFFLISKVFGYFPGDKLGFAGRESRTVMKDWAYAVMNGKYLITGSSFNYEKALALYPGSITSISYDLDNLSSSRAVDTLLNKFYKSKEINKLTIEGFDHFNWAKYPDKTIKYC